VLEIEAPDPNKDAINRRDHEGRSLWLLQEIDITTALTIPARTIGGEMRWMVLGTIRGTVCSTVVPLRNGRMRPISLRAASTRERKLYAKEFATRRSG
jgi:uncharacterized DUF497 family protein